MAQIVPGGQSYQGASANSLGNPQADAANATSAHLQVTNQEGVPEQYELKLVENKKVVKTWPITLNNGQTWQQTIAYSLKYSMLAELYLMPNTSKMIDCADNGQGALCPTST